MADVNVPPPPETLARYDAIFAQLKDAPDSFSGMCAKEKWVAFGLAGDQLLRVWALADQQKRGKLDMHEHRIAMHLIQFARAGVQVEQMTSCPPALLQAAMTQLNQAPPAAPPAAAPQYQVPYQAPYQVPYQMPPAAANMVLYSATSASVSVQGPGSAAGGAAGGGAAGAGAAAGGIW